MKEVIIDRSKWGCRENYVKTSQITLMLNPRDDKMCCLGHICKAYKVSKKSMNDACEPDEVSHSKVPKFMVEYNQNHYGRIVNSAWTIDMININDSHDLTRDQREKALIKKAKDKGIKLSFKGRLITKK
jgi:hypothetical protein